MDNAVRERDPGARADGEGEGKCDLGMPATSCCTRFARSGGEGRRAPANADAPAIHPTAQRDSRIVDHRANKTRFAGSYRRARVIAACSDAIRRRPCIDPHYPRWSTSRPRCASSFIHSFEYSFEYSRIHWPRRLRLRVVIGHGTRPTRGSCSPVAPCIALSLADRTRRVRVRTSDSLHHVVRGWRCRDTQHRSIDVAGTALLIHWSLPPLLQHQILLPTMHARPALPGDQASVLSADQCLVAVGTERF